MIARRGVWRKIPAATYSPTRKPCSTIGSGGLNFRVRDGNGGDDWRPMNHRKKKRPAAQDRAAGRCDNIPAATYSPTRKPCSTIGSGGLNFRVREGNGWDDWRPMNHRKRHRPAAQDRAAGRFDNIPAATYSPTRKPCSTIGSGGLNFRVRDGNGWDPSDKATGNLLHMRKWCRRGRRKMVPRSTLAFFGNE